MANITNLSLLLLELLFSSNMGKVFWSAKVSRLASATRQIPSRPHNNSTPENMSTLVAMSRVAALTTSPPHNNLIIYYHLHSQYLLPKFAICGAGPLRWGKGGGSVGKGWTQTPHPPLLIVASNLGHGYRDNNGQVCGTCRMCSLFEEDG